MNDEIIISESMLIELLTIGCRNIDCVDCPFLHPDYGKICNMVIEL